MILATTTNFYMVYLLVSLMVRRKIAKAGSFLVVFILLSTTFFLLPIKASSSTAETVVNATFDITFLDGVNLSIKVKLDSYRIKIFGESYNTSQIRASYDENKGAFKQVLYSYVEDAINHVFSNCTSELGRPYVDENSLSGNSNSPVVFYMDCTVSLTSKFFGTSIPYISDFVNGFLDSGGVISYTFNFYANTGWNNTYHFITTDKMEIIEVNQNGILSLSGKEVTWTIENRLGTEAKQGRGTFKVRYENPTSAFDAEDIHLDIYFDFSEIERARFNCTINVNACRINSFVDMPSFVSQATFLPSDAIRMLVKQNLTNWEAIYTNIFAPIKKNVGNVLNNSFNISTNLLFNFNLSTTENCSTPYNTSKIDASPPITGVLSDYLNIPLCGISPRAFFAFVYGGGTGKITEDDIPLYGINHPFDAHLVLPEGLNGTATWNVTTPLNTTIYCSNALKYEEEKITRDIEVNLRNLDLDLISILTGKSNVVATIDVGYNQNLYHLLLQPEFTIPSCISIPYINSDLLRVCIEESIFKNMSGFYDRQREFAEQHVAEIFDLSDVDVYVDQAELDNNLQWDKNIKQMDDEEPFVVPLSAHISYKTDFDFSLSSFSLNIKNQTLHLKGIPGQDVTYKFVLPKGIEIRCNDSLNRTTIIPLDDGGTLIEVMFGKDEGDQETILYYSLKTSPLFTLVVFLPLILTLIIVVALFALLFYIRKRRRRLPPAPPKEERYIPPETQ